MFLWIIACVHIAFAVIGVKAVMESKERYGWGLPVLLFMIASSLMALVSIQAKYLAIL